MIDPDKTETSLVKGKTDYRRAPAGAGLGPAGLRLWRWATSLCETSETRACEPLLLEMCKTADRLSVVRAAIAAQSTPDTRLINCEVKLQTRFTACWKMLGLSDPAEKPKVGRPAGIPLRRAM
jgi:hypothetical protein